MHVTNVNDLSFKGKAQVAPWRRIYNAKDAIAQWEVLKHPQFTNIYQEAEEVSVAMIRENKAIREQNYSFLEYLRGNVEKSKFIEYFKKITGFPSLKESSQKILDEFRRVLDIATRRVNGEDSKILLSGYDRYCSVGLGSAIPGSDLDKGYAIIKGVQGGLAEQRAHSDRFKGEIWNNIDNRIMSVNHCAAFPNVMTDAEIAMNISRFDRYAKTFVDKDNIKYFTYLRMLNGNPISGSKFNIWLSERIPTRGERIEAKNFAYLAEAIRDGGRLHSDYFYMDDIVPRMNNSEFCWCSNITQEYPMEQKYNYMDTDITKRKLKARQEVEKHFDSWSIEKQYELVKDIIRSMSGDSKNPEFKDLFYSKADKHRLLINDILTGDVSCSFTNYGGGEQTHLFFNTDKALERYHNLNVYDTDY